MADRPQIRLMTAADLNTVIRLAASIPEAPRWPRPAWETYLAEIDLPRRIFVSESGRELTGFVAGQIIGDICELESIAVSPSHRRSGVATGLLAVLIAWARQRGLSRIQLEVRSVNNLATRFYQSAGFLQDGLRPRYYRDPEDDALLMSLPLAAPPQS
ncbi:MAG TPA: GNAT family N-acetyltransferase [Acidobacteriaceae bacterium]|nr:GNAT family N-acetyltransferase [Acidobacteriaceae bacterium]